MKKISIIMSISIMMILTSCSNDVVTIEQPTDEIAGEAISVTARMPEVGLRTVSTRVGLAQNELDVELTWKTGDQLDLCLIYGDSKLTQTVDMKNISADGKTAQFDITLPEGEYTTYDLYGVHGGGGLSAIEGEEHYANLPAAPWSGSSLSEIQEKDLIMLTFGTTGISRTSEEVLVNFEHIGSLFNIQLNNTGIDTLNNITEAQLIGDTPIWAHKNSGTAKYNLVDGSFVEGTTTSDNNLPFIVTETSLASKTLEFWGWYPPVQGEDKAWPAINLKLITGSNVYLTETGKPARTEATAIGKVYHFFATYNGTTLTFSEPDGPGSIITDIDGNEYNTVWIGGTQWTAKNLEVTKYNDGTSIPNVTDAEEWGALTTGALCDYDNTPSNSETYGKLYNWYAVNTGKLCPTGWHVPNDDDWNTLENYLIANGYNYDDSTDENKIAKALASPDGWPSATVEGSIGNNDYPHKQNVTGFSALPGSYRYGPTGKYDDSAFGKRGFWWSATETAEDKGNGRRMYHDYIHLRTLDSFKTLGWSVRCVRD